MTYRQELSAIRRLLLRHHRALRGRDKGAQWIEIAAGAIGDALGDIPASVLRGKVPGGAEGAPSPKDVAEAAEEVKLGPAQAGELAAKMHLRGRAMGRAREQRSAAQPAAEPAPAAEPEDPEPAFVFPKSETRAVQARENKLGRRLEVVLERPAIVGAGNGADGSCTNEVRPCPWLGCHHHLAVSDVNPNGTIRYAHPGKTLEQLEETCVLDVIKEHPDGATLEHVGRLFGLTRERVRQVVAAATDKGKDVVPASAA